MANYDEESKKPIFKKWWFWLIIVIILFGVVGSSGFQKGFKDGYSNVINQTDNTLNQNTNSIN